NAIASCNNCETVADRLARELHEIVPFDYLEVVSLKNRTDEVAWHFAHPSTVWNTRGLLESAVLPDGPFRFVHEKRESLIVHDWASDTQFPDHARAMADLGIVSCCILPLRRGDRRIGVLSFGNSQPNAYAEDTEFLSLVADQIALAVDAAVNSYIS